LSPVGARSVIDDLGVEFQKSLEDPLEAYRFQHLDFLVQVTGYHWCPLMDVTVVVLPELLKE